MTAPAEQDALYRAMVDDGIIAAGQAAELPAKRAEDAAWLHEVACPECGTTIRARMADQPGGDLHEALIAALEANWPLRCTRPGDPPAAHRVANVVAPAVQAYVDSQVAAARADERAKVQPVLDAARDHLVDYSHTRCDCALGECECSSNRLEAGLVALGVMKDDRG